MSNPFSLALIELMARKKLTQKALATLVGRSQAYISGLISGRTEGKRKSLEEIASKLGTTYEEMLIRGRYLTNPNAYAESAYKVPAGYVQIKAPSWDDRELSKAERKYLEMTLEVLRAGHLGEAQAAQLLRMNIKAAHQSIAALEETGDNPFPETKSPTPRASGGGKAR